jgi:hypothetical protein
VDWIKLAQDSFQWRGLVYGNETSGSIIEGGKFIDQLNDSKFLKNDSAPWG